MKNFKPHYKKEEVLISSHKTIKFYEDDNLMIFSSLEVFQNYQKKRVEESSNISDKKLLDVVNEWFILNPLKNLDFKSFFQLNDFGYGYDYLFADLLQKGLCVILDKKTVQFITTIKMIEEGHQIGPTCGMGGRSFYVKDQQVLSIMDWIS